MGLVIGSLTRPSHKVHVFPRSSILISDIYPGYHIISYSVAPTGVEYQFAIRFSISKSLVVNTLFVRGVVRNFVSTGTRISSRAGAFACRRIQYCWFDATYHRHCSPLQCPWSLVLPQLPDMHEADSGPAVVLVSFTPAFQRRLLKQLFH